MPYKSKEARNKYQNEWIQKRRDEWISLNGPCKCGSLVDLEVDHINPHDKTMNPRSIWSLSAKRREEELAKCQVLCAKCHKEKTKAQKVSPCGTKASYNRGCRCLPCTQANTIACLAYREKKKVL